MTHLLSVMEQKGHASSRVGDRVVGGLYLPTLLKMNQSKEQLWDAYANRRDRLVRQHTDIRAGLHRLKVSSGDTAGRDPAIVPWGGRGSAAPAGRRRPGEAGERRGVRPWLRCCTVSCPATRRG
ncbi:hypothetical protein ACFQZC_00340 [Streptacidiphilus monticola]